MNVRLGHEAIGRKIFCFGLCALLLALGLCAEAEQAKVHRIGFLGGASPSSNPTGIEAFRQGLRDLGYVEGKNIVIEYRWAEGKAERLSELSAELVSLKPDVLFTQSPQGALAAKKATTTIPIIFLGIGDPVGIGIIASLARPGGNITGLTNFSSELSGKRLELLKESVPKISVVAVLWNGTSPGHPVVLKETEVAARSLGLTLQPLEVRIPDDFDGAFQAARSGRAQALLPLGDPLIRTQLRRILDFAAKSRLPAMYAQNEYVEAGGLMSYGPDMPASFRRAATYVDKILKSTKPADLPVEQPMKFEFVINLKTAKALNLTIPQSVLYRADKVIK
jgi:putative tryptophan/tyrosine transport system substrate-binding protein